MANSSSTVEIVFKATDLVSSTANNIKDTLASLNKGNKDFKAPQGLGDMAKEFGKLDKGGKIQTATGALSAFGDQVRSMNTQMNSGTMLSKFHNSFDKTNSSISNGLDKVSKIVGVANPMAGMLTQALSVAVKLGGATDKVRMQLADPVVSGLGATLKDMMIPTGSITKGFQNWRTTLTGVASGLYIMKGALGQIEKSFASIDQYTTNKARLGIVSDKFGEKDPRKLYEGVYDLAGKTRSSFQDSADIISKLGINVGSSFKNSDELLKFAETVNKSLVIGGASGTEKQSSLLQLQQSLASGVLQGDEFRSLSENAPVFMDILAKGFKVNRGELKKLGTEGKLTTDKLIKAVMDGSVEIDKMFDGIPKRASDRVNEARKGIAKGMEGFKESMEKFLNTPTMDKLIQNVEPVFKKVGTGLSKISKRASAVFDGFVNGGFKGGFKAITEQFSGLSLIMGGLFKGGITGGLIATMGAIDEISKLNGKGIEGTTDALIDLGISGFKFVGETATGFIKKAIPMVNSGLKSLTAKTPTIVKSISDGIQNIAGAFSGELPSTFSNLTNFIGTFADNLAIEIPKIGESILSIVESIGDGLEGKGSPLANSLANVFNTAVNWLENNENRINSAVANVAKPIGEGINSFLESADISGAKASIMKIGNRFMEGIKIEIDLGNLIKFKTSGIKAKFVEVLSGINNGLAKLFKGLDFLGMMPEGGMEFLKTLNNTIEQYKADLELEDIEVEAPAIKIVDNNKPPEIPKPNFKDLYGKGLLNPKVPEQPKNLPLTRQLPRPTLEGMQSFGKNNQGSRKEDKSASFNPFGSTTSYASEIPKDFYTGGNNQKNSTEGGTKLATGLLTGLAQGLTMGAGKTEVDTAMTNLLGSGLIRPEMSASVTTATGDMLTMMSSAIQLGTPLIMSSFTEMFTGIGEAFTTFGTQLQTQITTMVLGINDVFTQMGMMLSMTFGTLISTIGQGLMEAMTMLTTSLTTAFTTVMTSLVMVATSSGMALATTLVTAMTTAMSQIVSSIASGGAQMQSTLASALSGAVGIIKSYAGAFQSAGRNLALGMARGIASGAGAVANAAASLGSVALGAAKSALAINSPSKVFAKVVGSAIPEGIAKGINDNTSYVTEALGGLARNITSPFNHNGFVSDMKHSVTSSNIKDEKEKVSEDIKAEILSASRIRYIEKFSKVTHNPSVNTTVKVTKEADVDAVLSKIDRDMASIYNSDLAIAK